MALQSSGAISLSDIKTELGSSANDFRTLHAAAGFSTPDSISEFYGYSSATEYDFLQGDGGGFEDYPQACSEAEVPFTLYSVSSTLGSRVTLFNDSRLTDPFAGGGLWYKNKNTVYSIDKAGVVVGVRDC